MTKEEKAIATWKLLIHADREKMSLQEFTVKVNEYKGGDYELRELRAVFEKLKSGPEKLIPPQK